LHLTTLNDLTTLNHHLYGSEEVAFETAVEPQRSVHANVIAEIVERLSDYDQWSAAAVDQGWAAHSCERQTNRSMLMNEAMDEHYPLRFRI
jgi:hypothetical protein